MNTDNPAGDARSGEFGRMATYEDIGIVDIARLVDSAAFEHFIVGKGVNAVAC